MGIVLGVLIVTVPLLDPPGLAHLTRLTAMLVAALLGMLALARRLSGGERPAAPRAAWLPAALFCAAAVAAGFASGTPAATLWGAHDRLVGVVLYLVCAALFLSVVLLCASGDVERALRWWAAATVVAAAYALVVWAGWSPVHPAVAGWGRGVWGPDLYGTFDNPDFAAGFLGLSLPLVASTAWRAEGRARRLAAAGCVGCVAALVLTGTLTALVTSVAGLLPLLVLAAWRLPVRRRAAVLAGAALAGVGGAGAMLAGLAGTGPLAGLHTAGSVVYRWADLVAAWRMFLDRPPAGVGPGLYGVWFPASRPLDGLDEWSWWTWSDAPFNVPLQLLAEGGLMLAAAYLVFVVSVGWHAWRLLGNATGARLVLAVGVAGAWLAYHTQSLVSMDVPVLALAHWVLAAVIVVLAREGSGSPSWWRESVPRLRVWVLARTAVPLAVVLALLPLAATLALRGPGLAGIERAAPPRRVLAQAGFAWVPARWEHLLLHGRALEGEGRTIEALVAYRRSIAALPRNHWARLDAARLAARLGHARDADRWYAEFLLLEPNATEVLLEYAELRLGAFGDARGAAVLAGRLLAHPLVTQEEYDAALLLCGSLDGCAESGSPS